MSYAAMTYDLVNILEKLSIDRCILIGHSMGGKTVMSTALKNGKLVEKLIVVDSAPTTSVDTGNVRECIEAMRKLDLNNIKNKNDANIALSKEIEVGCYLSIEMKFVYLPLNQTFSAKLYS